MALVYLSADVPGVVENTGCARSRRYLYGPLSKGGPGKKISLRHIWRPSGDFVTYNKVRDQIDNVTISSDLERDIQKGVTALAHYLDSLFWEWSRGLALLFWRWPKEWIDIARDRFPIAISGRLPSNKKNPWRPPENTFGKSFDPNSRSSCKEDI